MSKNAWTRVEYTLLLRVWQEAQERDAADNKLSNSSPTTPTSNDKSSSDKVDSKSIKSVAVRTNERFNEILEGGTSKRTQNAATLQRAVLLFNFSFILQYNKAHGANAWVSLSHEDREEVYNREKTTSYYFVDLDPSMIARLTAIRKLLANGSAATAAAIASASSSTTGSGPGMPPKDESSSSSSDDDESASPVDRRTKKMSRKNSKESKSLHKFEEHAKTRSAAMLDALDVIERDVRRLEKLVQRDQHGRRGADSGAKKKLSSGDEKLKHS
ncbi:hypothetical protein Gpo141_00008333 [Globisporangium polare]